MDVVDNQIETTHKKSLDRKKRDLDAISDDETNDDKETIDDASVSEQDEQDGQNERIDRAESGDVRRQTRQLRPPPIGQTSWQYNNNYELTNVHHEPARDQRLNVNYNPFLVPPSSQSNQFFKNGGSNEFFHLSPFANTYTSGKPTQSNAVTEFNSHKPFTVHTSFDLNDAPAQYNVKRPNKDGFTTSDPFYPIVGQKPKTPTRSAGDNLPDNFSYYHIGNTGNTASKGGDRDSFLPRPAPQPQQQPLRLAQPQAPIYYLNKPAKILSASTPKNHVIQFSTVGGFFNNNPTAFAPIENQKKQKLRLSTEKYDYVTHRPIYREQAPVPVRPQQDDDSYYEIHDVDQPYIRPTAAHRPVSTPPPNPFYAKDVALNIKANEKERSPELYTYQVAHVTTEEIKIPLPNKNKGFHSSHNTKLNDGNVKVITKQTFAQPAAPEKHHSNSKRPSEQDTANRFIEEIRESQRTQINKPKLVAHTQHLPNDFAQPHKFSTTTVKAETTTLLDTDDYYYYDNDEETKPTTTKKRPTEIDQTTYLVDQRYKPTTVKSSSSTSTKLPKEPAFVYQQNVKANRPPKIQPLTQEYFEYDDDDDEEYEDSVNDDGNEFKYKLPPVNVSKFMPMSETAAPRPAYMITTTSRPKLSSTTSKYSTQSYIKNHASKSHAPSVVPSILKFPDDVFGQGVRPNTNNNNQSIQRPYTVRPRNKTVQLPSKPYSLMTKIPLTRTTMTPPTTTTTTPTPPTTGGKTYRPYTKTRGQDNRYTKASKRPNSLKKHLWELDERLPNRY